jgi:hypothetical protein
MNNRMPKLMWKYTPNGKKKKPWKAFGQGRIRAVKAQLMTNDDNLFRIKSFEVLLIKFSPVFCYFLPHRFYSQTPSSYVLPLM